jgi:hypothetical protein
MLTEDSAEQVDLGGRRDGAGALENGATRLEEPLQGRRPPHAPRPLPPCRPYRGLRRHHPPPLRLRRHRDSRHSHLRPHRPATEKKGSFGREQEFTS